MHCTEYLICNKHVTLWTSRSNLWYSAYCWLLTVLFQWRSHWESLIGCFGYEQALIFNSLLIPLLFFFFHAPLHVCWVLLPLLHTNNGLLCTHLSLGPAPFCLQVCFIQNQISLGGFGIEGSGWEYTSIPWVLLPGELITPSFVEAVWPFIIFPLFSLSCEILMQLPWCSHSFSMLLSPFLPIKPFA